MKAPTAVSIDPTQVRTRSASPGAQRMRRYRQRRRQGTFYIRVELSVPDINALVRLRFLRNAQRRDPEALQVAVMSLIYRVLEGAA